MKHDSLEEIIGCVVCGYKQGGTTFFASMLAASPHFLGRFETGLLKANNADSLKGLPKKVLDRLQINWDLSDDNMNEILNARSFLHAYNILIDAQDESLRQRKIIDKFPDYAASLTRVASHLDVPIFFVSRDPRALYWSRLKRILNGSSIREELEDDRSVVENNKDAFPIDRFANEYCEIFKRFEKAESAFSTRIHTVKLESLVTNFNESRTLIFKILNEDLPTNNFGDLRVSDEKVRKGLDLSVIDEYRRHLSQAVQDQILERCITAERFFWR